MIYLLHALFGGWPPLTFLSFCLFWTAMIAALYNVCRRQLSLLNWLPDHITSMLAIYIGDLMMASGAGHEYGEDEIAAEA